MPNPFFEGLEAGRIQNEKNPFYQITERLRDSYARRLAERKKEDDEIKQLNRLFMGLGYKEDLARETNRLQEEEERKTELAKQQGEQTLTEKQIGAFGGKIPLGTTARVGNLTIPLNPEIPAAEMKAGSPSIGDFFFNPEKYKAGKELQKKYYGQYGIEMETKKNKTPSGVEFTYKAK